MKRNNVLWARLLVFSVIIYAMAACQEKPKDLPAEGMSVTDLEKRVQGDKYVLVDYSAVWCGPCKVLAPIVDKIVKERSDKLTLLKVDADKNKELCTAKGIEGIPYLELYNKGKLVWKHVGLIAEKEFLTETKL